jgi:hypothetical protein
MYVLFLSYHPMYTLAGFDFTTHNSCLLGVGRKHGFVRHGASYGVEPTAFVFAPSETLRLYLPHLSFDLISKQQLKVKSSTVCKHALRVF